MPNKANTLTVEQAIETLRTALKKKYPDAEPASETDPPQVIIYLSEQEAELIDEDSWVIATGVDAVAGELT